MADTAQVVSDSQQSIIKLKNSLDEIASRSDSSYDANALLSEATALFKDFFTNLADPEFSPKKLITGDTPNSEIYNSNLRQIYNDLSRFYVELTNLSNATIKSYNFSQVVINEIKKRASGLASMVLDLNILSNFTRGDLIVAGDDFINMDNIDTSSAVGSSIAELVSNGAGVSLARSSTNNLSLGNKVTIDVYPISPSSSNSSNDGVSQVNTAPTPNNFNRFYEGNYYNFLGQARPEGGKFNLQYIVDPSTVSNLNPTKPPTDGPRRAKSDPSIDSLDSLDSDPKGIFIEYGASNEDKGKARLAMIDGNPDTFWECEYIVKLQNPLMKDVSEALTITEQDEDPKETENVSDPDAPTAAAIQIDVADLNNKALGEDILDLIIDIVVSFPEDQNVNFVAVNPVVFSQKAFIEVVDISTISSQEGEFRTVDNWEQIRFPKTITPEANEYLTDSQVANSLSPSRQAYLGQGIYPFPIRVANKIKIRLKMDQPSSQVYERTYALLKNDVDVKITTTTTTKKGYLRF